MDPASASIAFVGFTASLATLAGLVLQSSRVVHEICQKVKDTPKEVTDLQDQLVQLHGLLQGLKENAPVPTTSGILLETWQFAIQQLQNDMDTFSKRIQTISKHIKQKGSRSPFVGAAFRNFYEADVLKQYQVKFAGHIGAFTLLQAQLIRQVLERFLPRKELIYC